MSRRFCWLLLAIVASIADLTVSESINVPVGSEVDLLCKGESGYRCAWTVSYADGSSDIVAITGDPHPRERYILTDKPQEGDCSLKITNVQMSDAAPLTCKIGSKEFAKWEVVVQSPSQDPYIEYNTIKLQDGEVKQLAELPAQLKCIVEGGNPEPVITWESDSYLKQNVSKENTNTINTVTIEELSRFPPQIVITCVAEQPLYENGKKSITVTVGEAYTTTEVKRFYDKNSGIATCTADGIPEPKVQWKFSEDKDKDKNLWTLLNEGHNATIDKPGYYVCVAVDANGMEMKESEYLHNENGEVHSEENSSSNTQQAGMIVGIVIAALVVIAIIGGLTLFTFRRRTLCFKERRPMPTNNPSNVENGGKIQTINSPDSKEKSEMKGDQNDNTKQKEIVYAQLDLPLSQGHNVNTPKPEEKTEYAQIKFQPKENQV